MGTNEVVGSASTSRSKTTRYTEQRTHETQVRRAVFDRDGLQAPVEGRDVDALPATSCVTIPAVWRKRAAAALGTSLVPQA